MRPHSPGNQASMACDDRFPHPRAMMLQEEVIALSMCKASEISWLKEKPSYSLLVSEYGWNQRTQLLVTLEINMVAGGGALPGKTWESSLEKRWGWLGCWNLPEYAEVWVPGLAHTGSLYKLKEGRNEPLFTPFTDVWARALRDLLDLEAMWLTKVPTTHVDYRRKPEARQPPA